MSNKDYWLVANQLLCAKIISELHYEELIHPTKGETLWKIVTSNREWLFNASQTIWGSFIVEPESIQCSDQMNIEACQLLIDLQSTLNINDINLANLLEEIQSTLFSDIHCLALKEHITSDDIINLTESERQKYLDAHPKAIANKGRLGWGEHSLKQYSPESGHAFKLHWIAISKQHCLSGITPNLNYQDILRSSLSSTTLDLFNQQLGSKYEDYWIIAVHPWQYQRFIVSQYAMLIANGGIVDLGEHGIDWLAQQSIRTLSATDPEALYDAKTALTILNTSCYRGIPGDYIVQGPKLSSWLHQVTMSDALLQASGLYVQQEVAGFYCPHPYQHQIKGGPYRYNEMLGCIWRERAEHVIAPTQRPMSMATLMQYGPDGKSLLGALVEQSGVSLDAWLSKLFNHVVIPLYHLMCKYGVGLVAHGQNITLVLENNLPVGCTIKDFHGDLRLIDQPFPELDSLDVEVRNALTRLPSHYLVHDLLTGHFVTVLRFISPKAAELGLPESEFYRLLYQAITEYQVTQPALSERFEQFNLLSETIDKICVNRVRFKIGYGDSDERPLPDVGQPIDNPLRRFMRS